MKKIERMRKRKMRKIRAWAITAFIVLIAGMAVFALKSPYFNVRRFLISGSYYYTTDEIMMMGKCKAGGNIFTGVDCSAIRKRLMQDPYMADVIVRRKLPATIEIKINERKQVAGIVYGDKYVVIDNEGIVLRKTSVDPKVTILRGMTISKLNLGEKIEVEEGVLYRQSMTLIATAADNSMYFKGLNIEDGEVKAYILKNLLVEGSYDNMLSALETGDIQLVVQELFNKRIERGTIKVTGENYVSFTPKINS